MAHKSKKNTPLAPGVAGALAKWRRKHGHHSFNNSKKHNSPSWTIVHSDKLAGNLLKITREENPDHNSIGGVYHFSTRDGVWGQLCPFMFFKKDKSKFGTYIKKVPFGEIVIATGNYAVYDIVKERQEMNAAEVVTTKGLGYIYRPNLTAKLI